MYIILIYIKKSWLIWNLPERMSMFLCCSNDVWGIVGQPNSSFYNSVLILITSPLFLDVACGKTNIKFCTGGCFFFSFFFFSPSRFQSFPCIFSKHKLKEVVLLLCTTSQNTIYFNNCFSLPLFVFFSKSIFISLISYFNI